MRFWLIVYSASVALALFAFMLWLASNLHTVAARLGILRRWLRHRWLDRYWREPGMLGRDRGG